MSILVIVLIILLGLFLLVLEFFVFPGVSVAGIGGVIFTAGGIYLAYVSHGSTYGNIALISTLLVAVVMIAMSLRSNTWNRLMLQTNVSGQVETVSEATIKAGDTGVCVTRLNPIGKVKVNNEIVEGRCPGQFVNENTEVQVIKVHKTYIIVKPKNS